MTGTLGVWLILLIGVILFGIAAGSLGWTFYQWLNDQEDRDAG